MSSFQPRVVGGVCVCVCVCVCVEGGGGGGEVRGAHRRSGEGDRSSPEDCSPLQHALLPVPPWTGAGLRGRERERGRSHTVSSAGAGESERTTVQRD